QRDGPPAAEEGGRGRVDLDAGVDVREHADAVAPVDHDPEWHAEPDAELAVLGVLESVEEIEPEARVARRPRAVGESEARARPAELAAHHVRAARHRGAAQQAVVPSGSGPLCEGGGSRG